MTGLRRVGAAGLWPAVAIALLKKFLKLGRLLRVEYAATDLGRSLGPDYTQVCDWASANPSQGERLPDPRKERPLPIQGVDHCSV